MSDKFTIVGFVAQALTEKWSYLQMAEGLARVVSGVEVETAADTILREAKSTSYRSTGQTWR